MIIKFNLFIATFLVALLCSVSVCAESTVSFELVPSAVNVGSAYSLTVDYANGEVDGFVKLRLKDATDGIVEEWSDTVTVISGTSTFVVTIPETALGDQYKWYAELQQSNSDSLTSIETASVVISADVENSISFVTAPTEVSVDSTVTVEVSYISKLAKTYVQVKLRRISDGLSMVEGFETVTAADGTVRFNLTIPDSILGNDYYWWAQLMDESWGGIASVDGDTVTVNSDNTITYFGVCSDDDIANGVKCYVEGESVRLFDEDMGNGYWSNWYLADSWVGPLKGNFKEGTTPWVEWTNETTDYTSHNEFDIKIQKSAWKESTGYPAKFSDIQGPIDVSMTGQYTSGSIGKGHINMTAWFTAGSTWDSAGVDRVDIIVHAFDNEGDFQSKYVKDGTGDEQFVNMGTFGASNGMNYEILRTRPGGCGELASYNLIPDAVIQEDPYANISTSEIESNIDMQEIINELIELEENFGGTKIPINGDWYVFNLEWTVVGQCGGYNEDESGGFIPNSKGRFTYKSFYIPDIELAEISPSMSFISFPDTVMVGSDYSLKVSYFEGEVGGFVKLSLKDSIDGIVQEWSQELSEISDTTTFDITIPTTAEDNKYTWYAE